MANPVDQRLDGPDGTPPSGDTPDPRGPADTTTPAAVPHPSDAAPRLPTRVPFAGPHPGSANADPPRSEPPPQAQPAPVRRTTPANLFLRSTRLPDGAGNVRDATVLGADNAPTQPAPPVVTPSAAGRPRTARVRLLSGAAVAAVLIAGSLWWSGNRTTGETTPAAAPEPETATTPITAPATGGAAVGSGTASGVASAGPTGSVAPSPTPSPRPTAPGSSAASPSRPAPGASVNASGRNLALNSTVTASSVEREGWAASNAVDGDLSTRWSSGFSDPQWLRVDLGARWQISEIRLNWENAHATAYRVEVSVDGTTWKSVYGTSNGRGGTVVVEVAQLPARFVRVYGTKRSTDYGYSLHERFIPRTVSPGSRIVW